MYRTLLVGDLLTQWKNNVTIWYFGAQLNNYRVSQKFVPLL